jgi:hypothetical protein
MSFGGFTHPIYSGCYYFHVFLVSRCRVVHLFVVFVVVCSISWLVFINCVVMYFFVCSTSNSAVSENENVFISISAN